MNVKLKQEVRKVSCEPDGFASVSMKHKFSHIAQSGSQVKNNFKKLKSGMKN